MNKTNAIRDPIHKWIELSPEELAIIDTPLFQRLRYITQLTATSQVFPCGIHNRFSHCIGVMYIAGKYASHLFKGASDKNYWVRLSRVAALLHDIGHGPFSHAYDNTVYKAIYPDVTEVNGVKLNNKCHGHDIHRLYLITSEPLKTLVVKVGVSVADIVKIWTASENSKPIYRILNAFIQGPLGSDRIDFLLRDAYFTGTKHFGALAHDRIISNSRLLCSNGKEINDLPVNWHPLAVDNITLHYNIKVIDDIFRMLMGRFYMYKEVYFHKTSMSADMLVQEMISAAMKPLNLINRTTDVNKFVYLTNGVTSEIMSLDAANPPPECTEDDVLLAKTYCRKYLHRELPRMELSIVISDKDIGDGNIQSYLKEKYPDYSLENKKIMCTRTVSTVHCEQFAKNNIMVYDLRNSESLSFRDAIIKTKYFSDIIAGDCKYIVVRVYSYD